MKKGGVDHILKEFFNTCTQIMANFYRCKQPELVEQFIKGIKKLCEESLSYIHSPRLKVAIVSPGLFSVPPVIGSSVEHDIEMVSKVMQENHDVVVYTRKCPEYPVSSKEENLEIRRIRYRGSGDYLRQVVRDLLKLKPDIIQVENRPHYVPMIKRKLAKIPIILNMHSMQFASVPWISQPLANQAMKMIDALITNSRYLERQYIKRFPVLKDKAYGIHLGIDPSPYIRAQADLIEIKRLRNKFGIKRNEAVLLFVGRVKKEKGVHHLIRAMPHVIRKNKNVKLLIVGSPRYGNVKATSYLKSLQKKAQMYKRNIVFTKFINPYHMPYIYQLADMVVTPSVWGEPFCRVNLEAMSAGKPIVTTNRGGIPEVVKTEENGYVLPLKNLSRTLPKTLNKLLNSEENRKVMGKACMQRAEQFTWENTTDNYLSVYHKVLQMRDNPRLKG